MEKKRYLEERNGETVISYIFTGSPYFGLDNFYPDVIVEYEGIRYNNSECAFQSAKTLDMDMRQRMSVMNAAESKVFGKNPRYMKLRPDWEDVKDRVMYDIVKDKMIRNPFCYHLLMSTEEWIIEEGNFWHDEYWGVDYYTKEGKNMLGRILMKLRTEFKHNLI